MIFYLTVPSPACVLGGIFLNTLNEPRLLQLMRRLPPTLSKPVFNIHFMHLYSFLGLWDSLILFGLLVLFCFFTPPSLCASVRLF